MGAFHSLTTSHARNPAQIAVQLYHLPVPGQLMQAVDVLSNHPVQQPTLFKLLQRGVGRVGPCLGKRGPATHAAGPIAPPRGSR